MNSKILLICLIVQIIGLCFGCIQALKKYLNEKKKNKTLEKEIENKRKNLIYIIRHSQELADIETSYSKLNKEIAEAKNDEEVINIINTIIDTNNGRLHNHESK